MILQDLPSLHVPAQETPAWLSPPVQLLLMQMMSMSAQLMFNSTLVNVSEQNSLLCATQGQIQALQEAVRGVQLEQTRATDALQNLTPCPDKLHAAQQCCTDTGDANVVLQDEFDACRQELKLSKATIMEKEFTTNSSTLSEILKELDVDVIGNHGKTTLLHKAAKQGRLKAIETLLFAGALVDARDGDYKTPLHLAAQYGHLKAIEALISAGALVDAQDVMYRTPLHYAARYGHLKVIEVLVSAGAKIDARGFLLETPLHHVVEYCDSCADAVEMLIDLGAELDPVDRYEWTPLHWAAYQDRPASAKILVDHGADTEAIDYAGRTPLGVARQYWNRRMVDLLLPNSS